MREVLDALYAQGISLHILTSNSTENVKSFSHAHHLEHIFSHIISSRHLFGKHRALRERCGNLGISNTQSTRFRIAGRDH